VVLATKGHLKDLPPKDYGIDFKNNYTPTYVWLKGKKSLFSLIKKHAKLAKEIFIASDPDREGEMIAEHISEELGKIKARQFRIRLPEISRSSLESALKSPGFIDTKLVDSQICRRLIDRIFGFEISPVLWKDLKISGLSAGRVQSSVLKWICEREIEIRNFKTENFVSLEAIIQVQEKEIPLSYVLKDESKKLDSPSAFKILTLYGMKAPGETVGNLLFHLISIEEKNFKNFPPFPFSTASLQETAAKVLGFSSSQTMRIAQNLYEGKRIDGEVTGLITYMRTDSNRLSDAKINSAIQHLKKTRPELNIAKQRNVKTKLHAQEGHEAVSPTDPTRTPDSIKGALTKEEFALYNMIWERIMVSLLEPETGVEKTYIFESKGEHWISKQKVGKTLGHKEFKGNSKLEVDELASLKTGSQAKCNKILWEDKKTSPKERYTEGQLIAKMEKTGIGRPSTYAQILETLKKRKYVIEVKKKLGASGLGEKVNNHLLDHFSALIGEQFTKDMETALDELATGKGNKLSILTDFYREVINLKSYPNVKPNSKIKNQIKTTNDLSNNKNKSDPNSLTCPVCKVGKVSSKFSKNGKTIYFCSKYPQCDYVSYDPPQK